MDSVLTEMSELDTPALVVDLDVVKSNLARMARAARAKGVKLRPHIKTHKSLYFTAMQLEHGASGITVAKLGEAEVMAGGGVDDVLLAYPPIGEVKLKRLAGLLEQTRVIVSVDSVEAAEGLSRLARRLATSIEVYIDVDTGLGRMGLPPGGPTVRLAEAVARLHGLEVIGLMSHCGHVSRAKDRHELARIAKADAEALVETADVLRQRGLPVREVSPGSTLAAPFHLDVDGVTEIRPGTYIFNDANTVAAGSAVKEECAVSIVTTVVSRPAEDRAVVDAGSKSLASDPSVGPRGFGIVKGRPDIVVERLSEEHGVLRSPGLPLNLAVGDRVEIIPNHVCNAVNLADTFVALRRGRVIGEIPVSARGKRT